MQKSEISTYDFNNKQTALGVEIVDLSKIMTHKDKALKAHRLNFYQILIITKGRGIHEVDFQLIAYSENTVIPVAMGQVQRFTLNPNLAGYAILFTPDFLIKENSSAIGAGNLVTAQLVPLDILGKDRTKNPTIGSYDVISSE